MDNKKNGIPKLRFPGFTGAWEQRKLGEVVERRIEKRRQSERYPRLAFASGQGVIPLSERKTNNREQLTKDEFTKKYLVTELDDIVYNPANVKYGAIDRNKYGRGLISPIYVTFTTEEVPGFIERIVKSHDFKQKALRFEEGTVTKRQSVNPEDLVTINILVASQKKEQKKISLFFDNIDTFIALHQRKLEHLQEQKKGLLQKMFPKNGETVPEVRFPGFTDAWEQRKLGEVVERFDNLRIPVTSSKREKGITPYYGANGIQDYVQGYTHDGEFVLVAEDGANDLQNYPVHYVNGKVWVNNHAHVLQGKKDIADNLFLVNAIKRIKFETYLVGGSRAKLNADVMMKLPIKVPTLNEQQKLGKYFSRIDSLIALHQRKLEHLELMKKGLLQQMFV
ncbi:restriction endonuclease subunit S [Ligilactobacillus salivarius]|uniref:restriction endonuclease subunit S n=1 Tax=Ligilactobacillus salivarius TaxID=1624 RepID=UPI00177E94E1|nr:restriction endonuclease subunit S [Ligilactobacillus salivarius]QXL49626.1 restriction endonuclease subunit S [Ligilactobacillus salivarius]